jgi:hypothetical protein
MKQSSGETSREDASPCQLFNNDLVPRTQRSAPSRCAAEPGPMQQRVRGFLGPGSAQQREEALQRVRDTRKTSVVVTVRHCAVEIAKLLADFGQRASRAA